MAPGVISTAAWACRDVTEPWWPMAPRRGRAPPRRLIPAMVDGTLTVCISSSTSLSSSNSNSNSPPAARNTRTGSARHDITMGILTNPHNCGRRAEYTRIFAACVFQVHEKTGAIEYRD